ncbi:PA0069 family radical SAM protein [Salmonirosea aquatica]|uniref:PA0069 family radical SAM protein n=1 Tax=Salmonirosea aquatica TaxID=2654236 RepID=A0A7C9F702_9BACT|nr:PA0069 family radical SAM protein [Cytophagaceae bacterium SJW1-29]
MDQPELPYRKGRGAQKNTANPNQTLHYEPDEGMDPGYEEMPALQTKFYTETPVKIISKVRSPDVPMMKSINPYQGCEHGCIYCYARNSHEFWGFSAGLDFESKIMVKKNAPQLLEKEFLSPKWLPASIALSGNTDCYQPAERRFELTRRMLEVCLKYRNPVAIITKNALILRDIDLLTELARLSLVHVYITLTTLNEDLRRMMEPRTVTARQRLNVIRQLTEAGVPTGVMTAPIIPGLTDHEIPQLIETAAEAGALDAGYTVVRLNGAVAELFEDWIWKTFPERAEKVLNQIKACHGGQLNDSRWGLRMIGEGPIAEYIRGLHTVARKKYLRGRGFPRYDLSQFRREGLQMKLF